MHKKYQSPLAKMQPKKMDLEKIKKQGWNKDKILVINVEDDRLSWPEREILKQIGNRIYNLKKKDGGNNEK